MGIITGGILGGFSGKVGAVVGANWKGIDYMKQYTIPANPQSSGQTEHRTKFKAVVQLAQVLLGTLVATFWNPFAVKMSGFNAFVKSVFPDASATGLVTASCIVTKGSLEAVPFLGDPDYNTATGAMSLVWNDAITGNGLSTDSVGYLVIDKTNNQVIAYNGDWKTRGDGSDIASIGTGYTATNLVVFIFAHRGTAETFMVSNSSGDDVVAAA